MRRRKKGRVRGLIIAYVLSLIVLCGSTMTAMAWTSTPICGGNHSLSVVRFVGEKVVGDAHIHMHDGYICAYALYQEQALYRCPCGYEEVNGYGECYYKHNIDYSSK